MKPMIKDELLLYRNMLNIKIHGVILDSPFTDAEEMVRISQIFNF
jgi:hypothetical protein